MARRFFSIPGTRHAGSDSTPLPANYRGALVENLEQHPHVKEFFDSRSPTSHTTTGFEPEQRVAFRGDGARIEGEERDRHTGKIEQYVQRSDQNGSGTYRNTWEPNGPRGMVLTETKRIHE